MTFSLRIARSGESRVTKSELIDEVARIRSIPRAQAELAVNTMFETMVSALASGEGIEIRGFGSFTVRQYGAYEGRNPKTGEVVLVPPKRLPYFKVGKALRERVNAASLDSPIPLEESGAGGSAPDDEEDFI